MKTLNAQSFFSRTVVFVKYDKRAKGLRYKKNSVPKGSLPFKDRVVLNTYVNTINAQRGYKQKSQNQTALPF